MSKSSGTNVLTGKTALITGGLGFIGSALARALAERGARVRILDSLLPQSGASSLNVAGVADKIEVVVEDVRSRDVVDHVVQGCDVVLHFAGQSGPKAFGTDIVGDIDVACLGTMHVLDAVRVRAPNARVVFASSYHVYGRQSDLPVAESASTDPTSIFGVHKLAAEKYCGVYAPNVDVVVARLSTVIGPRLRLEGAPAGTVAHVLDGALHGDVIRLHRAADVQDVLFVDDAVDAILAIAAAPRPERVINVASGAGATLRDIAGHIVRACGRGSVDETANGSHSAHVEQFVADVSRLRALGVKAPTRPLEAALRETVQWFRGQATGAG